MLKIITEGFLNNLVAQARKLPRLRKNGNVHADYSDPCQRLFNAIEPGSYIPPHCHDLESLFAIRGSMALITFHNSGVIEEIHRFGVTSSKVNLEAVVGIEIPAEKWHTVVSLESGSILLEVKTGPFNPSVPKFPAPWAPPEGSSESREYLRELYNQVISKSE